MVTAREHVCDAAWVCYCSLQGAAASTGVQSQPLPPPPRDVDVAADAVTAVGVGSGSGTPPASTTTAVGAAVGTYVLLSTGSLVFACDDCVCYVWMLIR